MACFFPSSGVSQPFIISGTRGNGLSVKSMQAWKGDVHAVRPILCHRDDFLPVPGKRRRAAFRQLSIRRYWLPPPAEQIFGPVAPRALPHPRSRRAKPPAQTLCRSPHEEGNSTTALVETPVSTGAGFAWPAASVPGRCP